MSSRFDRLRKRVQRSSAAYGSKECAGCNSTQRMPRGPAPASVPESVYRTLRSPGTPLDEARRAEHARALGHDLTAVRIHHDTEAAVAASEMNAYAFTFGRHVVLAADAPDLAGPGGRELLRHELTHAVQHQSPWDKGRESLGMLALQGVNSPEEREAARAGSLEPDAEADTATGDGTGMEGPAAAASDPLLEEPAELDAPGDTAPEPPTTEELLAAPTEPMPTEPVAEEAAPRPEVPA